MEVIFIIVLTVIVSIASLLPNIKIFDSADLWLDQGAGKRGRAFRWATGALLATSAAQGRIRRTWTRIVGR